MKVCHQSGLDCYSLSDIQDELSNGAFKHFKQNMFNNKLNFFDGEAFVCTDDYVVWQKMWSNHTIIILSKYDMTINPNPCINIHKEENTGNSTYMIGEKTNENEKE